MDVKERWERKVAELRAEMMRPNHSGSWFCGATILNKNTGRLLVVPYWRDYIKQPDRVDVKFPGGTEKASGSRRDTNPFDTLCAEVDEEVLGDGATFEWFKPFYKVVLDGGKHVKYFSLIDVSGPLRREVLYEGKHRTENGTETEEKIGPPEFHKIPTLARDIFPGHRSALKALVEYLAAAEDPGFAHDLRYFD